MLNSAFNVVGRKVIVIPLFISNIFTIFNPASRLILPSYILLLYNRLDYCITPMFKGIAINFEPRTEHTSAPHNIILGFGAYNA